MWLWLSQFNDVLWRRQGKHIRILQVWTETWTFNKYKMQTIPVPCQPIVSKRHVRKQMLICKARKISPAQTYQWASLSSQWRTSCSQRSCHSCLWLKLPASPNTIQHIHSTQLHSSQHNPKHRFMINNLVCRRFYNSTNKITTEI